MSSDLKLSPWHINLYRVCPRKYYYQFSNTPKLPERYEEALKFGSLFHKVMEQYYKIIPHSMTPKEILLYLGKAMRNVGLQMDDRLKWHIKGFQKFETQRLKWYPNAKPIAVEKRLERGPFYGIVDALFRASERKRIVVDWKTSYRWNWFGPSLNESYEIAGTVYKYIAEADDVLFVFPRYGKVIRLSDTCDINWLVNKVKPIFEGIKNKKFDRKPSEECNRCPFNLWCWSEKEGLTLWEM